MVYQNLGVEHSDAWKPYIERLYECYLLALKEYTKDSRGDIGAWVREAAMSGLHVRILFIQKFICNSLTP